MLSFSLHYKFPEYISEFAQEEEFLRRVKNMANQVQTKISEIFKICGVTYTLQETRLDSSNMPNFLVAAFVNDDADEYTGKVLQAQSEILKILEQLSFDDEVVECWFQRVKGKWGKSAGKNPRHPHPAHGVLGL